MAKISAYPNGGALQNTDKLIVARSGENKSILGSDIEGAAINFIPSWTNVSVGNGTLIAKYSKFGKRVHGIISLAYAAAAPTTSITGVITFAAPVTPLSYGFDFIPVGDAFLTDYGVAVYQAKSVLRTTNIIEVRVVDASAPYAKIVATSGTVPFTFGASDLIVISFDYLAP